MPGVIAGHGSAALSIGRFDPDGVSTSTTRNAGSSFYRGMVIEPDGEGGDITYGIGGLVWLDASRVVAVVGADTVGVYRSGDAGVTWSQSAFLDD